MIHREKNECDVRDGKLFYLVLYHCIRIRLDVREKQICIKIWGCV